MEENCFRNLISFSKNILKSYKNVYWLVGGEAKKGDKFILKKKYFKNITAYIYGKNKSFFKEKFKNKIKFKIYISIENALKDAINDIGYKSSQSNIIFSPSAASFDQFKNFEERGKYFNFLLKKFKLIKN